MELEEIRNEAYDMLKSPRVKTKIFHDRSIYQKNFVQGWKIMLYDTRLHLFVGKLKTRWSGPFRVQNVFPRGAVKVSDPNSSQVLKVNRQKLKPFLAIDLESDVDRVMGLYDPFYNWTRIVICFFSLWRNFCAFRSRWGGIVTFTVDWSKHFGQSKSSSEMMHDLDLFHAFVFAFMSYIGDNAWDRCGEW